MSSPSRAVIVAGLTACIAAMIAYAVPRNGAVARPANIGVATAQAAVAHDTSVRLANLGVSEVNLDRRDRDEARSGGLSPDSSGPDDEDQQRANAPIVRPVMKTAP